jgi:uncharacterized protein YraI
MKTTFLAAASALLLSAGAAAAAAAVTEAPFNLHARASLHSAVVGTVPGGVRVDVRGCTHGWCRVRFGREIGFAPRRLLALAGGPAIVAAAPGYVYDEPYYDYSDYGYDYGPGFGVFVGPGGRFHHRRRWSGHTWQNGTWNGTRTGTWQGGSTGTRSGTWQGGHRNLGATTRMGTSGIARGGGAPGSVSPQVSAPTGMRGGASVGGGAAVSAPHAGATVGGGAVIRR